MRPLPVLIAMAAAVLAGSAFAAEPAAPAEQPAQDQAKAPAPQSQPAADKPATPADAQPGSEASKSSKGTPQRFVPSEQVRADFDVSFPIDT